MNFFKSVYCNQYEELKRTGRDASKARQNGIIIISVGIVLNLFTLFTLLSIMGEVTGLERYIERNAVSGKAAGKLIAALLFLIVCPLVWWTIGSEKYFNKTVDEFEALPEVYQKQTVKRGMIYLFGTIGLFFLMFIVKWIAS